MVGKDDLIQKARERRLEEAAARARAQAAEAFDREAEQLRQLIEQNPELAEAFLNSIKGQPLESPPASEAKEPEVTESPEVTEPIETVGDLLRAYRADPRSGYRNVRPRTRQNYDSLLRRIENDLGSVSVAELDEVLLKDKFHGWAERGLATARGVVAVIRIMATFGWDVRKDRACRELKMTIHEMRFPANRRSSERAPLTRDHAIKIRAKAHELGWHSIALAQAIQFDTGLRQTDCIGEWVDINYAAASDVLWHDRKWIRGLRWNEIDKNLVLRHTTSQTGKEVVFDLRKAPMVMEELDRLGDLSRRSGPVIVCEDTARPYEASRWRRAWRSVARECGVPDNVYNMDSRPDDYVRPTPHRRIQGGSQ